MFAFLTPEQYAIMYVAIILTGFLMIMAIVLYVQAKLLFWIIKRLGMWPVFWRSVKLARRQIRNERRKTF